MTTLRQARDIVATALTSALPGTISGRPPVHAAAVGDGWVSVRRVYPGPRFGGVLAADLEVLIVLGTDEMTAEDAVDSLAPIAVTAITTDATITALGVGNISLEPQVVVIDSPDPAQLFALVLAVTITELEN